MDKPKCTTAVLTQMLKNTDPKIVSFSLRKSGEHKSPVLDRPDSPYF